MGPTTQVKKKKKKLRQTDKILNVAKIWKSTFTTTGMIRSLSSEILYLCYSFIYTGTSDLIGTLPEGMGTVDFK